MMYDEQLVEKKIKISPMMTVECRGENFAARDFGDQVLMTQPFAQLYGHSLRENLSVDFRN